MKEQVAAEQKKCKEAAQGQHKANAALAKKDKALVIAQKALADAHAASAQASQVCPQLLVSAHHCLCTASLPSFLLPVPPVLAFTHRYI